MSVEVADRHVARIYTHHILPHFLDEYPQIWVEALQDAERERVQLAAEGKRMSSLTMRRWVTEYVEAQFWDPEWDMYDAMSCKLLDHIEALCHLYPQVMSKEYAARLRHIIAKASPRVDKYVAKRVRRTIEKLQRE